MALLTLSQELIIHILSYLHYKDLNTAKRVNKAFNRLIHSSVLLQYSMQLQLSGCEDNPSSPMVIIDKLNLLRQQEQAWSRLDFEKQTSVRIPFNPSSIYDLSDGILLLGESSSGRQSGADSIRWSRMSTLVSNPTQQESWQTIDVGAHVIDVGLAAQEHDLIVVATDRETDDHLGTIFELRLVQLSTGLNHPLASKPIVPLVTILSPPHVVSGHCSVCIEITGDLLCFMFHHPSGSTTPPAMFEVYNWKSGDCLQVRAIECSSYSTFTFLAPNIIALPNCTDNTIELCLLDTSQQHTGTPKELKTASILQLPRLGKNHSIAQVTCRSEPKMTHSTRNATAFRTTEPFHLNPKDAIVIFNVMTHDAHGFHECLTLIVHSAALLTAMAAPPPAPSASSVILTPITSERTDTADEFLVTFKPAREGPPRIPWAQWGPRACRWLETSFGASRWITTTCGQRYVTVEEDSIEDDLTRSTIVVYDFNPHTVRRLAALHRRRRRRLPGFWDITLPEGEMVAGSGVAEAVEKFARADDTVHIPFTDPQTRVIGQIQCEPTELMEGYAPEYRIFEEPVRTSLPYAQSSSFDTFAYGAVLLDRNTVIGVKLNDVDDIGELVIHSIRTRRPGP